MTQTTAILAYLRSGESLTPIQALGIFGSFRLGARIYDLKELLEPGEEIVRDWYETPDGARVARYSLVRREPVQLEAFRLIATEDVEDHHGGIVPRNAAALGPNGKRYREGERVS